MCRRSRSGGIELASSEGSPAWRDKENCKRSDLNKWKTKDEKNALLNWVNESNLHFH